MTQIPPLNGLRAFEVAGRHLNFRAAAGEMGVTQAAVAQHVRHLEAHLGFALFERLPKGLAFTSTGRRYHGRVAVAFEELRVATAALRPAPDRVLVSVTPTFAAKWLIPNLPDFAVTHPDIDLQILATEKVSSFHGDGIDLAVRQGQPPFGASLDVVRLFHQEIIAVAAPALIGSQQLPIAPDVLAQLPKLHDAHDLWPAYLKRLKIEDRGGHGLGLSQTALAMDAALSGQGVALVSSFLAQRDIAAKHLVQLRPETLSGDDHFYLLARRGSKRSASIQTVLDWFVSKADA